MFRTRNAGQDVFGLHPVGDLTEIDAEGQARQHHRAKVGAAGAFLQGGEVQAGGREQLFGLGPLNPALEGRAFGVRVGAHDVELGRGRRILECGPGIAGPRRLMHHQDAGRPATAGFQEFVGPAAVEGHGLAVEHPRDGIARRRLEIRVVDQDDDHLAAHVHVLEVVPLTLGRGRPIADEDDGGVRHGDMADRPVAGDQDVRPAHQVDRPPPAMAPDMGDDGRRAVLARARQMGDLDERPVRPAALGAGGAELFDQPGHRLLLARRGGSAAFELVRSQHPHRLVHPFGVDHRRIAGPGGRGQDQRQAGQGDQGRAHQELRDDGGTACPAGPRLSSQSRTPRAAAAPEAKLAWSR